jgi:hypothetical protein
MNDKQQAAYDALAAENIRLRAQVQELEEAVRRMGVLLQEERDNRAAAQLTRAVTTLAGTDR